MLLKPAFCNLVVLHINHTSAYNYGKTHTEYSIIKLMFRAYDTDRSIMVVQSNVVYVSEKQKQLKVFGYE